MKTVIRHVGDIDARDREAIERVLGQRLRENQRLVIDIVDLAVPAEKPMEIMPSEPGTAPALPPWCGVYEGLSDEQLDDIEKSIVRLPGAGQLPSDLLVASSADALYNRTMESIIRHVRDINADQRRWIEQVVGHQLQDNQQVIIRVLDVDLEPDHPTRRAAHENLQQLSQQGDAHRTAQGASEPDADEALEEAMQHVRPRADD